MKGARNGAVGLQTGSSGSALPPAPHGPVDQLARRRKGLGMVLTRALNEAVTEWPSSRVDLSLSGGPGRRRRVPLRIDAIDREEFFAIVSNASLTRQPVSMVSANLHWVA